MKQTRPFSVTLLVVLCLENLQSFEALSLNKQQANSSSGYDEVTMLHQLYLSQASYCVSSTDTWDCATCEASVVLTDVVDTIGGRALVGYDGTTETLFVSYRGSEDIPNWIENIKFFHTSPYPEMPDVGVELGFYEWYTNLREAGVETALASASQTFGISTVTVTGHSAGGAVATLMAFDLSRGNYSGFSLASVTTFGSPRAGDSNFYDAHTSLTSSISTRVTHYHDMVPHLPEELLGYHHVATEVYFNEDNTEYTVCDGSGEDNSCSNSCSPFSCTSIDDHLYYMDVNLGSTGDC